MCLSETVFWQGLRHLLHAARSGSARALSRGTNGNIEEGLSRIIILSKEHAF